MFVIFFFPPKNIFKLRENLNSACLQRGLLGLSFAFFKICIKYFLITAESELFFAVIFNSYIDFTF